MGLFRSKWERQVDNNLFDYIDIDQFRNYKISTLWNYATLWFLLLLHTTLYGVDVYTCIRLLAFNTWGSQIQPWLSFRISKWLFAACIICSIVLLVFETLRGIRIFKTRNISLIYTNPSARTMKSVSGYGYFCVLNEVSPSGGFEKMAFYTYFTFCASTKLILADSPRQVINALTLWSVLNKSGKFWDTIKTISLTNRSEALILYGMSISFFIWIFFIAELFFAIVFSVPVLYRILHKMRYQSLRQYVGITVDKTVKKLAREHQKISLQKRKPLNQPLAKPSIPNIDVPITPLEKDISKSSTFDSISTIDSNPFSDNQKPTTTFKEAVQKPIPLHHKPSSMTQLNRYDEFAPVQSIHHAPSTQSLNTSYSSSQVPPSYVHQQQSYYQQQPYTQQLSLNDTRAIPPRIDSRPSFEKDLEKGEFMQSEHSLFNDSMSDLEDFELDLDEYYTNDEPVQLGSTILPTTTSQTRLNRKEVRPSLILRAKEMESEDYTRFNPNLRNNH